MARLHSAKKNNAGHKIKCGKCGDKILPGTQYLWWQFKGQKGKNVRCTKSACRPRASDLTQGRIGQVYAITEAVEDACEQFRRDGDFESFQSEIESQCSEIESLADEFQSGFDNMPEGLQQGDTGQMIEQRVEALNEYKDELENAISGVDWPDADECSHDGCGEEEDADVHQKPADGADKDAETAFDHEFESSRADKVDEIASEIEGVSCNAE